MDKQHIKFIKRSFELAAVAVQKGNHPFGSLLVRDGLVILESENSVNTDSDVTAHAELKLIRQFSEHCSETKVEEVTLYASTEPCVMCLGALYWAGVRRVVFGVRAKDLADLVGESFVWPTQELVSRADGEFEIIGPVMSELGLEQHRNFWV